MEMEVGGQVFLSLWDEMHGVEEAGA
jgi:hypothetical protein